MLAFSRHQRIEMYGTPGPAQPERIRQEFRDGKGQVHHDPVELPRQDTGKPAGIREYWQHVPDPVLGEVLQHQFNSLRVEIGGDNECRFCRKGDRKRSETGKHVKDDLAFLHLIEDPLPFRGKPGGEVGTGKVNGKEMAVLGTCVLVVGLPARIVNSRVRYSPLTSPLA